VSIGSASRAILGEKLFQVAGTIYRRIFFNAIDFVECTRDLFADGHCIDIGGGDGFLANRLLSAHPELAVTLVDPSSKCGTWVSKQNYSRFSLHPSMTTKDLLPDRAGQYDSAILADVVHHVMPEDRVELLRQSFEMLKPGGSLLIKEIEPQGLRSKLAYLADVYISRDPIVYFISEELLLDLIQEALGESHEITVNNLVQKDYPNYALQIIKTKNVNGQ
jgi:2-polyprenyl-3-methyl-5-hydroxy-6-metoxy-1,4-benzoquinol methylase